MEFRAQIENYVPQNLQERTDKEMMLKCIDMFDDVLTRDNNLCHFTCAACVVSKDKKKMLMEYHNIYDSWTWEGGHVDGESDFLAVAIREVEEETGVVITDYQDAKIISIETLPVSAHLKHGKWVNAHVHLNVTYLFYVEEDQVLRIKPDENSGVEWKNIDEVLDITTEPYMKPVYNKLFKRIREEK